LLLVADFMATPAPFKGGGCEIEKDGTGEGEALNIEAKGISR